MMAVETKSEIIPVRVTPTQAEHFRRRAESEGRRLSEWMRELALREASPLPGLRAQRVG